jgi:P4 family phage/plasmid primase-like protien
MRPTETLVLSRHLGAKRLLRHHSAIPKSGLCRNFHQRAVRFGQKDLRNLHTPQSQVTMWGGPQRSPERSRKMADRKPAFLGKCRDGANGKSTYLRAVRAFIGEENVAALSLQRLENDRFAAARLVGKLANICPDLPSESLSSTSSFKAITGGDALLAERKFEESFEFVPFTRLIFSANHPPKSADASPAFFRRWVVVPFVRTFQSGDPGTLPRDQLDAMLADPAELGGALNKALQALASIRAQGFSESDSTRRAMDEFRQSTDPLGVWLDHATVEGPEELITCERLLLEYNNESSAKGRPATTKTAFGVAFSVLRPAVETRQRTVNNKLSWCYVGIALASEAPK